MVMIQNRFVDEDFLLMFLRSANFNVEKSKNKMTYYYANKIHFPQWWANRELTDENLKRILYQRVGRLLINDDINQPAVGIASLCK
ncbi:hypothetical protein CHUAL_001128 [Chamberlinius hualienensis]